METDPRKAIKEIREQVDKLEASLTPNELDKAMQAVTDAERFFTLERKGCSEIVLAIDVARRIGKVTLSNQGKKPHFEGDLFIQARALSAIERLDEVFKEAHDC